MIATTHAPGMTVDGDITRRALTAWPRAMSLGVALALALGACTPTVQLEAPKEPITINLNVKLDADVRLRIEEKAEDDVEKEPIF